MIEQVINDGHILAIIVRAGFESDGIEFFTPDSFPQQLGYMKRKKGYMIEPHKHIEIEKKIAQTFETLIVRKGRIKVFLYNKADVLVEERIISQGDIVLLSGFAHGFEMLEDSEIVEVKQGPYIPGHDKITIFGSENTAPK